MLDSARLLALDNAAQDGKVPPRPLRVAVLVDLLWDPAAGGHVKFWERLAAGAVPLSRDLDLTIHFSGETERLHRLSDNVRYRLHRPVFSTRRLPFLSHIPDHTDLASHHGRLARGLERYDVIHTTDAYFCFAKTAERIVRRHRIPLVHSIHTDTPRYARLYTTSTLRRLFGSAVSRWLADGLGLADRAERGKLVRLIEHQRLCAFVLGPREEDLALARRILPGERVRPLKRGLDLDRFHPRHRDRQWLKQRFGIPHDTPVVLAVGRINSGKNIQVLAEAVARLATRGTELCLVCAGAGEDRALIEALLGGRARCPGPVIGDDLGRLYASADMLAHPSEIESFANVVAEAMASGLPALVAAAAVTRHQIQAGVSGLEIETGVANWQAALAALVADPTRRVAMGRAARAHVERAMPSWENVAANHFLPIWRRAYQESGIRGQ